MEHAQLLSKLNRYRIRRAALDRRFRTPVQDGVPGTGTDLHRKLAAAVLNLLHALPDDGSPSQTLPGTGITNFGLAKLIDELKQRGGVRRVTHRSIALRLLDYLTEPAKGSPDDGQVNLEHLARLVVVLKQINLHGWNRTRRDVALLGGTDMADFLGRHKRKNAKPDPTAPSHP